MLQENRKYVLCVHLGYSDTIAFAVSETYENLQLLADFDLYIRNKYEDIATHCELIPESDDSYDEVYFITDQQI